MFDTLADRIKQDEGPAPKMSQRLLHLAAVLAVALVLFTGLYLFVQHIG